MFFFPRADQVNKTMRSCQFALAPEPGLAQQAQLSEGIFGTWGGRLNKIEEGS